VSAPDSLAALNDHLARVLKHADQLLAEAQRQAAGMSARFAEEAREAGEILHRTLEEALADTSMTASTQLQRSLGAHAEALQKSLDAARAAAVDLEKRVGRLRPDAPATPAATAAPPLWRRPLLLLGVSANLLLIVLLAVVLTRHPPAAPTIAPPALVPDAGARALPPAPLDAGPPPPAPAPCGALSLGDGPAAAAAVEACVASLCAAREGKPALPEALKGCTAARRAKDKGLEITCPLPVPKGAAERRLLLSFGGDCPGLP
jgi:hypothetical protein